MSAFQDNNEFGSGLRQKILRNTIFAIAILYVCRLGYLQIVQGNLYRLKAEAQAIKQIKTEPFRGMMYDRNGRAIVQNSPGFSVTVTPYEFTPIAAKKLGKILGVSDTLILAEVAKAAKHNKFASAKLSFGKDVGFDVISAVEERQDELPGVGIIIDPKRLYAFDGNAAHLLGYTREISEQQLAKLGDSYDPGDVTGQTGLEKAYEPFVRGQKGSQFIAVNKRGKPVSSFNDGKSDIQGQEGFDLFLGLDTDLQELAEKLLEGRRGGVVAVDPRTGEILCYVSKPDFDLRKLSGKESRAYFNQLFRDTATIPLFNRVSMPTYPPGSTWKPLMALMALQEGIITENTKLMCSGGYSYGGRFALCHGGVHGPIDVKTAIAKSCNSFFYQLGLKIGVDRFSYYGESFGFGQKIAADVTEEGSGRLPTRKWMNKRYGERGWTNYALMNWGIGQGEVSVTPLQMVTYIAAIANEGTLNQPHAVRSMYNRALKKNQPVSYGSRKMPVDPHHFKVVKEGMRQVVTNGTARLANLAEVEVCGKTGTAQTGGKDQSWFVCFAPKEQSTIALVVTAEEGGFGASTAGPIARKLLDLFFLKKWPADVPRDSTWLKKSGGDAIQGGNSNQQRSPQAPIKGPFYKPTAEAVIPRSAAITSKQ